MHIPNLALLQHFPLVLSVLIAAEDAFTWFIHYVLLHSSRTPAGWVLNMALNPNTAAAEI